MLVFCVVYIYIYIDTLPPSSRDGRYWEDRNIQNRGVLDKLVEMFWDDVLLKSGC